VFRELRIGCFQASSFWVQETLKAKEHVDGGDVDFDVVVVVNVKN